MYNNVFFIFPTEKLISGCFEVEIRRIYQMEVDNQADVKMLQAEVAELQSKLGELQTENKKLREKSEYHQAWGEKNRD